MTYNKSWYGVVTSDLFVISLRFECAAFYIQSHELFLRISISKCAKQCTMAYFHKKCPKSGPIFKQRTKIKFTYLLTRFCPKRWCQLKGLKENVRIKPLFPSFYMFWLSTDSLVFCVIWSKCDHSVRFFFWQYYTY